MAFKYALLAALVIVSVAAQQTSTPVPILKQINRVNDDGSYTYGYEAADGTFKVETRDKDGNVRGKYGYLDETGIVKTVDYAAGRGFEARGDHLPEQPEVAAPVDDWEEPTTTTRRPARKQQPAAPVHVHQPVAAPVIPQQPAPARVQQPLAPAPVQQQHSLPTPSVSAPSFTSFQPPQVPQRSFNDLDPNSPRRGFSFSFEAPVLPPTPRPLRNF